MTMRIGTTGSTGNETPKPDEQLPNAKGVATGASEIYRALVECCLDHIFMLSRDGVYLSSNSRVGQFGLETGESLVGRHLTDVYPPDVAEFYLCQLGKVFADLRVVEFQHELSESRGMRYHIDTLYPIFEKGELKAGGGICRDITEQKRVEDKLRESHERYRALSAHLQSVREEERKKMARDFHDELGQALTALNMDVSWLVREGPYTQGPFLERLNAMAEILKATSRTVKQMCMALRPGLLDDLGLSAAFEWELDKFKERTGLECRLVLKPEDAVLDEPCLITLYRILQEALTNIIRHACASKVEVVLMQNPDAVELRVTDNGKGITPQQISDPASFGILGMRERVDFLGGTLDIQGSPGKGTTVTVRIPANG